MFSIISTMFLGIGIGYGLRNWSILQRLKRQFLLQYSCYSLSLEYPLALIA